MSDSDIPDDPASGPEAQETLPPTSGRPASPKVARLEIMQRRLIERANLVQHGRKRMDRFRNITLELIFLRDDTLLPRSRPSDNNIEFRLGSTR
jgi:hypothetical protein